MDKISTYRWSGRKFHGGSKKRIPFSTSSMEEDRIIEWQWDISWNVHKLKERWASRVQQRNPVFGRDRIQKIIDKFNDNETVKKKVESIEKILGENDIKIEIKNEENKIIKNIDIQEYATNLDKKKLIFKFFAKNNTLFFKDITKYCEEKKMNLPKNLKLF